jgi:polysaccharide biosynthesis/export protein
MIAWTLSARWPRRLGAFSVLATAFALATAGCGMAGKHQPQMGIVDPHQPKELEMVSMPPYVIEPPDELEVSVRPAAVEMPLTSVTVQADGVVDLGFVGDVYLAGLTLAQAEQKIAEHLEPIARQKQIKEPVDVSVRLVNGSQSKYYYVMGVVTTQGKFPIVGNETVLDAILAAGLLAKSQPDNAYVVRPHPVNGQDQILKIDWEGITKRGDTMTNYQLFPGDRLIVPGGRPPNKLGVLLFGR